MFKSMECRIVGVAMFPLLVALYFMGSSVYTKWGTLQEMSGVATLTDLAGHVCAYVHETQKERGATGMFMGSGGTKFVSELGGQRKLTDTRRAALKTFLASFDAASYGRDFSNALSAALEKVNQVDEYRSKVSGMSITLLQALGLYTQHNAKLLAVVNSISGATDNAEMSRITSSYVNFLQGKERAGIERAVLASTFARDMFAPGALRKFGSLVAAQDTYFNAFRAQATSAQIAAWDGKLSDAGVAEVQRMRDIAFAKGEVDRRHSEQTGELPTRPFRRRPA